MTVQFALLSGSAPDSRTVPLLEEPLFVHLEDTWEEIENIISSFLLSIPHPWQMILLLISPPSSSSWRRRRRRLSIGGGCWAEQFFCVGFYRHTNWAFDLYHHQPPTLFVLRLLALMMMVRILLQRWPRFFKRITNTSFSFLMVIYRYRSFLLSTFAFRFSGYANIEIGRQVSKYNIFLCK